MNKFFAVITGVIVGLIASFSLIFFNANEVAYGEDSGSWWNSFVAKADRADFNWNSVLNPFGPSEQAKDLYNLIYEKLNRGAEKEALKELAAAYGLTTTEVQNVIGGSIQPIFNNPNRRGGTLTQQDAIKIMTKIQDSYALLTDLYQIQQEVDTATRPSEIFANDDLSDSGFDLIKDLSTIEEILFFEKTPSSIGGLYSESLTSPYNPVVSDVTLENYLSTYQGLTKLPVIIENTDSDAGAKDGGSGSGSEKVAKINIGETEKSISVLSSDVCEEDNNLSSALNEYDKNVSGDNGASGSSNGVDGDSSGAGGSSNGSGKIDGSGGPEKPSNVKQAPAADWLSAWCLGQDKAPEFPGGVPEVISLGGIGNTYLQDGTNPGNGKPFSADTSLCLDIQLIKTQTSSYQPGQSCVQCEVDEINKYLDQTLSHSLIPNKATGNLMESAKCKDAGTLFNMQFVTIWNPVPSPKNEDIIFGKNIFEEWNKFAKDYQPQVIGNIGFDVSERPEQSTNQLLKITAQNAPEGVSQSDLFNEVTNIKNKYQSQAVYDVDKFRQANDATNVALYLQSLLGEIQEMNSLFKNYKNTFNNIDKDALSKMLEKATK